MSSSRNGQQEGHGDPLRRLRYDDLASSIARTYPTVSGRLGAGAAPRAGLRSRGHSGRRFVILACSAVLVLWGALYLAFRDWRARYQERAAFGATQVVPAIESMETIIPPGVDPDSWHDAVRRTRAMLSTVTGSNLLSVAEMKELRDELDQAVARVRARPETARDELAGVWNAMADRAEFLLRDTRSLDGVRHPRPEILPPRSGKK